MVIDMCKCCVIDLRAQFLCGRSEDINTHVISCCHLAGVLKSQIECPNAIEKDRLDYATSCHNEF